jgi:phosphoglycolate phosphatase
MEQLFLGNIRLIIFDLDGTLVDAYQAINSSFNFTMRTLHLPQPSTRQIRKAVGWGDKQLLAPFVPEGLLSKALKIYRINHKLSLTKKSKLLPKARELLTRLSSKYTLAIASNRPTEFSKILLKALNINKYFAFLLCADKLDRGKPNPLILRKIIKHFKVSARQALYIGDMAIDAQTANRAKIKSIIVTTGSSSLYEIKKEKPFKIISNLGELTNYIS